MGSGRRGIASEHRENRKANPIEQCGRFAHTIRFPTQEIGGFIRVKQNFRREIFLQQPGQSRDIGKSETDSNAVHSGGKRRALEPFFPGNRRLIRGRNMQQQDRLMGDLIVLEIVQKRIRDAAGMPRHVDGDAFDTLDAVILQLRDK